MRTFLGSSYLRSLRKQVKKNPQGYKKIKDKITLFQLVPSHPSLKLHKLKGEKQEVWSIYIEEDLRILFVYVEEGVLFINIGKHDEVY